MASRGRRRPAEGADVHFSSDLQGVDWDALNSRLADDHFDNGRTPDELRRSFAASQFVVIAWTHHGDVVGTARLLADGVCNAYLVDVWTDSRHRRQGIGSEMVARLMDAVPGHHIALFTEEYPDFYRSLGFEEERVGMSAVAGMWLNRYPPKPPL